MQIDASFVCEAATDHNGKLSVLGVFDTIQAPQAPFKHPHCAVVVRVRFERSEEGKHKFVLLLIDDDGKQHGPKIEGEANIVIPANRETQSINLILAINGLPFPRFGSYRFDFALDGEQKATMPLYCRPRIEQQKAA